MKKKVVCVLMLMLILTSTLNIAFTFKVSYAQNGQDKPLEHDLTGGDHGSALSRNDFTHFSQSSDFNFDWQRIFQKTTNAQKSKDKGEGLGLSDSSEWSKFAYVDGDVTRLIVGVDQDTASLLKLEKIVEKHKARIVNTVSIRNVIKAVVVELPLGSVTAFVEDARIMELASYVEPNMKVQAQFIPNDTYWDSQWSLQKIQADWAWNTTIGSSDVLVAVVDTGIYYYHEDLAPNYAALGYDWVNMDSDPLDDHGHGTHCAGIIAAVVNNNIGIAGLAQVRVMAEKVLDSSGSGYWDWVANGIIHATESGARIISMSLGGYGYSELVHDAVKYAYDSGVLVIAAAGNDNTNMKSYPAGYDEVIAVAATDQYDYKAGFSNWGDWIELAAPGVSICSTVPWGYEFWSGTSMACPHVSGVAALVWSLYPEKTRDWLRLWLRYTADDLGDLGFDVYYGYGRINARKAVELTPPAHELIAYEWVTPPYVEPEAIGIINATVLNFGENDETGITVQLIANGTVINSALINSLAAGSSITVSLLWTPAVEGLYNLTFYVMPVSGEINLENNVLSTSIYVGFPVKAVVLHSAGNVYAEIITNWQALNSEWHLFGDTMIYIDYITLNKEGITYQDIAATEADVLIISCAFDPYVGWEFTDSEIEAISKYVYEGHGLIVTAGTLYYMVPNNNKLASLLGLNEGITWYYAETDLINLIDKKHPLFNNIPNPLVFPQVGTALPSDGQWDSNELADGEYLGLGHYKESAIVTRRGLVYISPWLEVIPPYYHHHLQLLYNAIVWSRYEKPEHELTVSLEAPLYLQKGESTLLNATVMNNGKNNETDVAFKLLIDGFVVESEEIPELPADSYCTITHLWTPAIRGTYNVTAYADPVANETFVLNNKVTKFVTVMQPLIHPIEGQYAKYIFYYVDSNIGQEVFGGLWNFTYLRYVSPYQMNVTLWVKDYSNYTQSNWMIVNIFTRIVEKDSGFGWTGMYYPGWIETDVDLGSTINLLWYNGTIVGSKVILFNGFPIECWEIRIESYDATYNFWYDKASGLWIGMEARSGSSLVYLMLTATNIPVGFMYEHDLTVMLDVPAYLELGDSAILNATIYNMGLNNETNTELYLLVNGTIVSYATIPNLLVGDFHTINCVWSPTSTGNYNITAYVPSVPGEEYKANNIATKRLKVFFYMRLHLLHEWVGAGNPMGWNADDASWQYVLPFNFPFYGVTYKTIYISSNGLITFLGPDSTYSNSISALAGKLAMAPAWDDWLSYAPCDIYIWQNSTHVGIRWYVRHISSNATANFEAILCANGIIQFNYASSDGLVSATIGISNGEGHILAEEIEDLNYINTIVFTPFQLEHDLAVQLQAPEYLLPGGSITLNATVINQGLSNETNVELRLLINGTIVRTEVTAQLLPGTSFPIIYDWTPAIRGIYNVTAYATPVINETYVTNNQVTKFIAVTQPLISPIEGQYANYTLLIFYRYTGEMVGTEQWNFTYSHYISSTQIYVEVWIRTQYGYEHDWMILNVMNRYVESGMWSGTWYSGWIETNVNVGSRVGLEYGYATVVGSRIIPVGIRDIDCWEVQTDYGGTFWYDKRSGLLVGKDVEILPYYQHRLALIATSVPIGFDHDVSVRLKSPSNLPAGKPTMLRVDVFNSGLNNETNVNIMLFINGSTVASTVIPELKSGGHYRFSYRWTPETEGTYNLTAYASPVINECYRENNVAKRIVSVFSVEGTYIVINPPETMTMIGETFAINITIANVVDLYAWQVKLYYDDTILNFVEEWLPSDHFFAGKPYFEVEPILGHDALGAYVMFGVTLLGNLPGVNGSGTLCQLKFNTRALGVSVLQFSDIFETYLLNSSVEEISFSAFSGIVEVLEFMPIIHDVAVTNVLPSATEITVGQIVPVTVSVENQGDVPETFNVTAYFNSTSIGAVTVTALLPGYSTNVTFIWNTTEVFSGVYTIWAEAEPVAGEMNLDNNVYAYGKVTVTEILHDVAVILVQPYRTWVYGGKTVVVNVTVMNKGETSENFNVALYYNFTSAGIIGYFAVSELTPLETRVLTFEWNTTGVSYGLNYTLTAIATPVSGETNTLDNTMVCPIKIHVRMSGDTNGDNKIDVRDVAAVARGYGEFEGRPRWNPDLDFNGDGKINIKDVALVAQKFGERCN